MLEQIENVLQTWADHASRCFWEVPMGQDNVTVLFVDDDDTIRRLCRQILQRCGYAVLEAESGETALKVLAEHSSCINLLVTDMAMPGGMDGVDLARRCWETKPGLRVLVISGYCTRLFANGETLPDNMSFLPKPFTPKDLDICVHECLCRRAAASAS
jgi:DNA-binding NtrC family response regulator